MSKIILGVNELSIQNAISGAEKVATGINEAVENVQFFLGKELKPDEVQTLFESPYQFLESEFLKQAEFTTSTLEFNLNAQGKYSQFHNLRNQCVQAFINIDTVTLSDGRAVVLTDEIRERYTSYAATDTQKEAYQLAEKLIPICERLKELKIISAYTSNFREVLKVVCEDGRSGLQINKGFISGLKYQR